MLLLQSISFWPLHFVTWLVVIGLSLFATAVSPVNGSPSPPSSSLSPSNGASIDNGTLSPTLSSPAAVVSLSDKTISCESRNSSCGSCVESKKCFYCYPTNSCLPFNLRLTGCTSLKEIAYGTCLVKLYIPAIVLGSLSVVIVLTILITCCCYCNCQRKRSDWEVDNQKENLTLRGSVIRDNAFARREERKKKVEEIKRKYGIPDSKYNRF